MNGSEEERQTKLEIRLGGRTEGPADTTTWSQVISAMEVGRDGHDLGQRRGASKTRISQPTIPNDSEPLYSRHNLAVGRLGCGFGGGDRATTFGHSEISIRSSSFFSPTPEELLKADAWTDGRTDNQRERSLIY